MTDTRPVMSDLVERLKRWGLPKEGPLSDQRLDALEAAARITALETSLAEAEKRVKELESLLRIEREHRNAPGPF